MGFALTASLYGCAALHGVPVAGGSSALNTHCAIRTSEPYLGERAGSSWVCSALATPEAPNWNAMASVDRFDVARRSVDFDPRAEHVH